MRLDHVNELVSRVSEHGSDPPGISIDVNECWSLNAIVALPVNREGRIVFLDVDRFGVAVAGQRRSELIGRVEQPRIAGFGGE